MSKTHPADPFRNDPPDKMTEEQLLSHLLAYCEASPEEASAQLLRRFRNLADLLDSTTADLYETHILSNKGLRLLRLVSELHRKYLLLRSHAEVRLTDRAAIVEYFLPLFSGATEEQIYLLSLDDAGQVLGCTELSRGDVNSANLPLRSLVKDALLKKASAVVLAHNHPSGLRTPSKEDVQATVALQELLAPLGIRLLDHLIFAESGHCSLWECGFYSN